jgi:hypothetical protein
MYVIYCYGPHEQAWLAPFCHPNGLYGYLRTRPFVHPDRRISECLWLIPGTSQE